MENKYPMPGRLYEHYKGGVYEFLFLSKHTENDDILVIYKSVLFGTYFARPLVEWNKETEDGGIRFKVYSGV